MTRFERRWCGFMVLACMTGCGLAPDAEASSGAAQDDGTGPADTSAGPVATGEGNGSVGAGSSDSGDAPGDPSSTTAAVDDTGQQPASWTAYAHSCPGASRTDALLVEDDAMWVGCGTNQSGYGLHASFDGGASWAQVETEPADAGQFRVSAIARGDDGLLYIAGMDASDGDMVLALDTSTSPYALTEILVAGNIVGTSFHVGQMALLGDGRIFVESLTGLGALWRADGAIGSDATAWQDEYYWANGGDPPGYQMQDLIVVDGEMFGCGATIAEPPYVFLPPEDAGADPFAMAVRELPNTGWTGEMWGVASDGSRVVVVGVDQDADVGKIYRSGADMYDASGYTSIDLTEIVGDAGLGTWARGVCMAGDRVAVVGERQPLSSHTGLVLLSEDGGASFANITPSDDVGESVSKCSFTADGTLVVAGGGGFVGVYR